MDRLSAAFSALADPTRRAILARLAMGDTTVSELAKPFAMSGPAVSKHLKVLESAGLISRGRDAQWRPCRLDPKGLREVDAWLEHYRQFWTASLDRLEDYLREVQADGTVRRPNLAASKCAPRASRSSKKTKTSRHLKE